MVKLRGGGVNQFYWKRIRRILPPYYAAILIFVLLKRVTDKSDVFLHLVLLHNFRSKTFFGDINSSFWSIAVECQIYLWFPFFVMAWRKWGVARSVGAALPLVYIAGHILETTPLWGVCLDFSGLFLIGAIGANFAFSSQPHIALFRDRVSWSFASFAFFCTLILFITLDKRPIHYATNTALVAIGWNVSISKLLLALSVSCMLVSATIQDNSLRRILSWRPLVWIGGFSYSLYLLHQPFVNFYAHTARNHAMPPNVATWIFLLVIAPTIVMMSYGFHLLIERPFMSSPAPKTERHMEEAAVNSPAP